MADGKEDIQSLKIVLNTTNSGDPCEMPHSPLFARVSKIMQMFLKTQNSYEFINIMLLGLELKMLIFSYCLL